MSANSGLDDDLVAVVLAATEARSVVGSEHVQRLWSGYGEIVRCRLGGGRMPSVIVKRVRWPHQHDHPRGWSTDRSHERKVRSYRVEAAWYDRYAERCRPVSRVPRCLAQQARPDGVLMVLEDLDAAGFAGRRDRLGDAELDACLGWLAGLHATFMTERPVELWPTGTYWHLATRPDELAALPEGPLKSAAASIDARLSATPFRTIVHGDAKVANFCFADGESGVAAVDFQYAGGGCGMKDVAYFVSSCFGEDECERLAPAILSRYFELLRRGLEQRDRGLDLDALESDWRALYPIAWTDFSRFLQGWSPGHWKLHGYSARLEREVLAGLVDERR